MTVTAARAQTGSGPGSHRDRSRPGASGSAVVGAVVGSAVDPSFGLTAARHGGGAESPARFKKWVLVLERSNRIRLEEAAMERVLREAARMLGLY